MELVCVNHWDRAIETHSRMHPEARHYCQDLATVRPSEVVPEGYLDLLMASPTCTYHSRARGGKPTSDQQRMDPWHIITWLTELRVKRVIIENVPEFVDWTAVDVRTGRPIKSRRGEYFRAWVSAFERVGHKFEYRIINCADNGDATTRVRFFGQSRSIRGRIVWPVASHSRHGQPDLFGQGGQRWRAAREIIEWEVKGTSILRRKKPLSPKTLMRIYAGALKFKWPEPFIVVLRQHMTAQGIDTPVPSITAGGTHIGLAEPVVVNMKGRSTASAVDDPTPTLTAHARHLAVAEPVLMGQQGERRLRPIDDPVPTITSVARIGMVEPFVFPANQSKERSRGHRPVADPLPTITATGTDLALVQPFILAQGQGATGREVGDPMPTIVGGGAHALIAPYYGSGSGETCKSVAAPLDTVPTKDRFGLVVPVTHGNGGPGVRSVEGPLPTLTTAKGGEFGLVMPVTHDDASNRARSAEEPLPTLTTAGRGELALITGSFGEREGQAPRVRSVDEPVPTVLAQGYVPLVEPVTDGQQYDILFRMLTPLELARAMSFSDSDFEYEFAGTKTEITKQIGNAVPVRTAQALVAAAFHDLEAEVLPAVAAE